MRTSVVSVLTRHLLFWRCHTVSRNLPESFFHLSQLLTIGTELSRSLHEVGELEPYRASQNLWQSLSVKVSRGAMLSEVMSQYPEVFDETLLAFIQGGEVQGDLVTACERCEEILRWRSKLKGKMFNTVFYPVLAITVVFFVCIFLLLYVVPSLGEFLIKMQLSLTWHTQMLLSLSAWVREVTVWFLVLPVSIILVISGVYRISWKISERVDNGLLHIPVLGNALSSIALGRYCYTCFILYGSGVVLNECMRMSEEMLRNKSLRSKLVTVRQRLHSGSTLDEAASDLSLVPRLFRQLLISSHTPKGLLRAFELLSQLLLVQAERSIERCMIMLGPIVLGFIGSGMAWIIVSLVSPVYTVAFDVVAG